MPTLNHDVVHIMGPELCPAYTKCSRIDSLIIPTPAGFMPFGLALLMKLGSLNSPATARCHCVLLSPAGISKPREVFPSRLATLQCALLRVVCF
jgi:hypothetical protein